MNDQAPSFIARIRSRLAHWLYARQPPDDAPLGVWVTEHEPAYQVLVLFGYPYPPGQGVDWDLEHDLSPVELAALIKDAVRQRVAQEEDEEDEDAT